MLLKSTQLCFIILLPLIFSSLLFYTKGYADLLTFDRQQIQDSEQDWFLPFSKNVSGSVYSANNVSDCQLWDSVFGYKVVPAPEIEGITYFSNGTSLNTTIWLSGPAGQYSDDFNNYSFVRRDFTVNFEIDSVFHSHEDYAAQIANDEGNWSSSWAEHSPRGGSVAVSSGGFVKDPIEEQNYVRFIIPLDKMNNPKRFTMIFSTSNSFELNNKLCHLSDTTSAVPVPPPEFTFSVSSNPLIVRQGDERTVQLQINSTSPTSSHVFFGVKNVKDIVSKLLANDTTVPPKGVASVPMRLKVSDHAEIRPYTVPLLAKIFLPTTVTHVMTGGEFNNTLALNTSKQTAMTMQVLPPLQLSEKISDFWTHLGSPITFIYGIIVISVPWLLNEVRKKYKKSKDKSISNFI